MTSEVLAQIIGFVAMGIAIVSFQQKSQRGIILLQMFSSFLWVINFVLLGGIAGALLNSVGVFRSLVFGNKQKFHADKVIWVWGFAATYLLMYVLTFTAFGKEPTAQNLLLEFLPVIGTTFNTIGYYSKKARTVRLLGLINSPMWLIYDAFAGSIFGVLTEIFCICSIVIGLWRFDLKKAEKTEN